MLLAVPNLCEASRFQVDPFMGVLLERVDTEVWYTACPQLNMPWVCRHIPEDLPVEQYPIGPMTGSFLALAWNYSRMLLGANTQI